MSLINTEIKRLHDILSEQIMRRGISTTPSNAGVDGKDEQMNNSTQNISGEITSRADVTRELDKLCEYFQKYEPSSPIPLLLQRAKRLVSKDFMEIMKDLVPDGVSQAKNIAGEGNNE
jgi:type VI secretion system protein ImpA